MGNELEDALRAAAALGKAKPNDVNQQKQTSVGHLPNRKKNKKIQRRFRRRSRSDSMASDFPGVNDDPVQRLEAFKARMFDVGKDTLSATFSGGLTKPGDDIVKVQWKSKPLTGGRRVGEGDENDAAVPQLTRAKVVKSQPVNGSAVVSSLGNGVATSAKKMKKRKKRKTNVQVEITVPQLPVVPLQTNASAAKSTLLRSAGARRQDEDVSSESEMELPAASVANLKKPNDHSSGSDNKPATPLVPAPIQRAKTSPMVKNPAVKSESTGIATANNMKTASAKAAAVQAPLTKSLASAALSSPAHVAAPTPAPAAKPVRTRSASITKEDEWDLNSLVQDAVRKNKAVRVRNPSMSEGELSNGDDSGSVAGNFDGKPFKEHRIHLFSQLIDEAARDQWELVEVGRLVRIFAAQWSHKKKKTARFLRRYCPELVSVDFLEGLNIDLTPKQLIAIFDRGSGSQSVLLNKVASAIENNNIHVQDDAFLAFVTSKTDPMATNQEVLEFIVPLLESMSKVNDVGVLLKAICQHWHVERTAALVQDILLTPVFDDLDGQQDEILEDLPQLEGRIDFPSRMDADDADENGNLEGLIAGDESDLGESRAGSDDEKEEELGEVLSEDAEGEDSHAEDGVYEGETDSEEEREARERLSPPKRRRSRFILDEAEEDEHEHEDEAMDAEQDAFLAEDEDESADSSDDSGSDDEAAKPQRKRLRRG